MVNSNTELRKLTIGELNSLARSLSPDAWKILMGSIRMPGSPRIPRFTSEDVRLIEEAGKNQGRPAAEVFISEWCTMGKTRPTVGSMIELLMEANLQRAADYLAVDILKGDPPERPQEGPAAAIDVSRLLDELNSAKPDPEMIPKTSELWNKSTAEMDFNDINYPSHISSASGGQSNVGVIEMHFAEEQMKNVDEACPAVNHQEGTSDLMKFFKSIDQVQEQKSDLMKFSSDIIDDGALRTSENVIEATNLLPSFSLLGIKSPRSSGNSSFSSFSTQTTSSIDSSAESVTKTDSMQSSDFNLPAMSQILPDDLKPANDKIKIDEQEIEHSVTSENIQDLPVTIFEFFKR